MTPLPIVYVTDMDAAAAFYLSLGKDSTVKSRSSHWTELKVGGSQLALHLTESLPKNRFAGLELSFTSDEALEVLVERFEAASIPLYREITDEAFGRSLQIKDPDGLVIQINEHDPELYG